MGHLRWVQRQRCPGRHSREKEGMMEMLFKWRAGRKLRAQLPQMAPTLHPFGSEEPVWYFSPAALLSIGARRVRRGDKIRPQS